MQIKSINSIDRTGPAMVGLLDVDMLFSPVRHIYHIKLNSYHFNTILKSISDKLWRGNSTGSEF